MRIISGKYKGKHLKTVAGLQVRPTSDKLRETLFNILSTRVQEAQFLDLCAGSGAIGIEALSRGAAQVTFVEKTYKVARILANNLENCSVEEENVYLLQRDALSALKQLHSEERKYDVIFLDPPYSSLLYVPLIETLGDYNLLTERGLLIIEHHSKLVIPEIIGTLRRVRQVRNGESILSFYELV